MLKGQLEKSQPGSGQEEAQLHNWSTLHNETDTWKSIEHNQKVFINFIDFKQVSDSIKRDEMWRVMQNTGIPEQPLKLEQGIISKIIKCYKGR